MRQAVFLVISIGLLSIGIASGQQSNVEPISFGETLTGNITPDNFHHLYRFEGSEGEIITVTMIVTNGDLDPVLVLIDQNGDVVAYSDDDGEGQLATFELLRLPTFGQYFIAATRFGHAEGSTTGTYELTMTRQGATAESGATLRYGDRVNGEIDNTTPRSVYFFQGNRGDAISIFMKRSSENLDPFIVLANQNREILVQQDDDPTAVGSLDAAIVNYTLPESGLYIILATRYGEDSGTSRGRFFLALEQTPLSERGLSLANAILLDYGNVIDGAINAEVPQRFYLFDGHRGDVVTLSMERTFGNLSGMIILLDENQRRLASSEATRSAQILGYSLPTDGTYYIMVTREDFSEGITEGEYTLALEGRAGIAGEEYREIIYETSLSGTISNSQPTESFVFLGEAGDVVTITMNRTNGNLDALLTLFFDNKQIVFDDDGGEGDNATIVAFRLPDDGIYRIEAARFGRVEGETSGDYVITLDKR